MGIQIYIKKSAVKVVDEQEETLATACECEYEEVTPMGYCLYCGKAMDDFVVKYCTVEGLDMAMYDFNELVCHDANKWGPSRERLLAFIEREGISDDDWYEA